MCRNCFTAQSPQLPAGNGEWVGGEDEGQQQLQLSMLRWEEQLGELETPMQTFRHPSQRLADKSPDVAIRC